MTPKRERTPLEQEELRSSFAELVRLCASDDPAERERGHALLKAVIDRIARRVVSRYPRLLELDAEDVASEIFLKVEPSFRRAAVQPLLVTAFLVRVTRNYVIDVWRRLSRRVFVPLAGGDETSDEEGALRDGVQQRDQAASEASRGPDAFTRVERGEAAERMAVAFAELDAECRSLLTHVFYVNPDLSLKDIAAVVARSHAWARQKKGRCLEKLRAIWARRYGTEPAS